MTSSPLQAFSASIPDWVPPPIVRTPDIRLTARLEPILKSQRLLSRLVPLAAQAAQESGRAVISLFGGSGAGKSSVAALLQYWLRCAGVGCLLVNGDNYPHRIPVYNDAERLRCFRVAGLKGLRAAGLYTVQVGQTLQALWGAGLDADPAQCDALPWLACYQEAGKEALRAYLGTALEQDYDEVNALLAAFHRGERTLWVKHMGRTEDDRRYDPVDASDQELLLLEWTHGGSELVQGVDVPVLLLGSTEETLPYRRSRNRDAHTDSPFTTMVLDLEQEKLLRRAESAALILTRDGQWTDASTLRRALP